MVSQRIRNFVIISHVDHGKSTLADRFLELTGTIERRKMRDQFLDQMDLEREKGITIKMQPVRMIWRMPNHAEIRNPKLEIRNKSQIPNPKPKTDFEFRASNFEFANSGYILNLIDTPGHADFTYEVSRALAAVEGAILLVDATQGIQAQTIANLHLAQAEELPLIPVLNKIDLETARVQETEDEIMEILACRRDAIFKISAKTGTGVAELMAEVVNRIPAPVSRDAPAGTQSRALIFDSHFDEYRGIIAHVRVFSGAFRRGDRIRMLAVREGAEVMEVGYFFPALLPAPELVSGEIGYLATGLKEPDAIRVGDTITTEVQSQKSNVKSSDVEPLPGYLEPAPVVFASVYPQAAQDYERLGEALKRMKLNDAAIFFEPESSPALGRGWRMGFLGMLHLEIIGERLKREYQLGLIFSAPSVAYRVEHQDGQEEFIFSAGRLPDASRVRRILEPWVGIAVITPQRFRGPVSELLASRHGRHRGETHVGAERVSILAEAPLSEILSDFSDTLKSISEGYASFRYEPAGYRPADLVRLDIMIAGEREEAFSEVVRRDRAYHRGRSAVQKLKTLLPRQLFSVSLQAVVAGRVIARETIPALQKNVTGYLYGGDRTRKMKLWKKQKRGKRRLAQTGRVEIPTEVFLKMLQR